MNEEEIKSNTEDKDKGKISKVGKIIGVIIGILIAMLSIYTLIYMTAYESLPGKHCYDDEVAYKPVMYFYPKEDNTQIKVDIDFDGKFNAVYPEFTDTSKENTWTFRADKDGTLTVADKFSNKTNYNYLFWDGIFNKNIALENGYCVAKEDTITYLEETLTKLGLNDAEKDDFITFWLPILYQHDYNIISFDTTQYEQYVQLKIYPYPDNLIRVFMTFKGCDSYIEMERPVYNKKIIDRKQYTVVEWGGTEIK